MLKRTFTSLASFGKSFHSKRNATQVPQWTQPRVLTSTTTFPLYSVSSPSMIAFGNKAVLSFRGLENKLCVATSENGTLWNSYQIPQLQSVGKPSLCKFGDTTVLAYATTTPNQIGIASVSDPAINSWSVLPSVNLTDGISSPPAIAALGNTVYLAYINASGNIKVIKNTDLTSSEWQKLTLVLPPQEATTPHVAPFLFIYKGYLTIAVVVGNDVKIARLNGNTFDYLTISSSPIAMNAISATEAVSAQVETMLRMAIRAPDSRVATYSLNELDSVWVKDPVDTTLSLYECRGAPALTYLSNSLILAFNSFDVTTESGDGSEPSAAQLIFTASLPLNVPK